MGYGGPDYFCDRVAETNELISALVNGRNVALISPRRLGKKGLIHHVFHHLQHDDSNRRCFYIDIYNTQNQQELVQLLAQTIVGSMDKFSEKNIYPTDRLFQKLSSCVQRRPHHWRTRSDTRCATPKQRVHSERNCGLYERERTRMLCGY